MTDRDKLILHLQNLAKTKIKKATLDVEYLLAILNALPPEPPKKSNPRIADFELDIDGGEFVDRS